MSANSTGARVCIMGCGRVGARLAELFYKASFVVTVIDLNADSFDRLSDAQLRDNAILGDGTDPAILDRAGIRDADIFIAVTNGDNRNIMASQVARTTFEVPHVLCRIYDVGRHEIYKRMGLNSFCPTLSGADFIFHAMVDAVAAPLVQETTNHG